MKNDKICNEEIFGYKGKDENLGQINIMLRVLILFETKKIK